MVTIKLTGWKAVAAGVVFLILMIAHQFFVRRQLDEQAIEQIRPYIQGEILSSALSGMEGRSMTELSKADQLRVTQKALTVQKVEFRNVTARGFGSEQILRVEITVDGQPPPNGKDVRYYRMEYSYLTGWIYRQEVTAFSYWTKLW